MKWITARATLSAAAMVGPCGSTVSADTPKELKVKSGTSLAAVNFVNPKSGCSALPGPVALSSLREKPANGTIQVHMVTDVAATGTCPAAAQSL